MLILYWRTEQTDEAAAKTFAKGVMMFTVKFWGVRGSIPAPLDNNVLYEKLEAVLARYIAYQGVPPTDFTRFLETLPFPIRGTYGGNTSCVEVRCGDSIIVLDMGTGLRPFGVSVIPEMFARCGLDVTFLLSHVHWDHIQGLPFFGPLFVNKKLGIANRWTFYGGTDWQQTAEACLRGQMNPPVFPVSWEEIAKFTSHIATHDLYDRKQFTISGNANPTVICRKLNHPQETYGWRILYQDKVLAYTTDQEPFDPRSPDPALVDLARDADLWITDCQYTKAIYEGKGGGVSRRGWGHSYPEAVVATAIAAGVKHVVLFHHDPASSDRHIDDIAKSTENMIFSEVGHGAPKVESAYESLTLALAA